MQQQSLGQGSCKDFLKVHKAFLKVLICCWENLAEIKVGA